MKAKRTTDLSVDVVYRVMAAEQGGGTTRVTDWAQIADVTPDDQRGVREDGWRDDFVLEACIIDGKGMSLWLCSRSMLAQCQADASSGVYYTF